MRITVLGNGAAGNLIGGLLSLKGEVVTLICADELHLNAVNSQGLWIEGITGHLNAKLQAATQMSERPDICLLNMPVQDIVPILTSYKELLQDVPVITLQNSPRAAEYAASVVGKQYILGAAVLFGANVTPGHVRYPVVGAMLVGEPFDSTGFAEAAVELLNSVVPTMYVDNIHGAHWSRLITSIHHGLAAATGLTAAQASEHPTLRPLAVKVMMEAADITNQKGIMLQSLPDFPPINKIISVLHMPSPVSDMIPRMLSRIQREEVASELLIRDLKQDGQTIVDFLNGEIILLGQELGLRTPYNTVVARIVKQVAGTKQVLAPELLLATVEDEVRASIAAQQQQP